MTARDIRRSLSFADHAASPSLIFLETNSMRKLLFALALPSLLTTPAMASPGDGNLNQSRPETSTSALRVALNWDEVAGRWKQFTGKAQQRWGKLTDDDLTVATGRRDELIGKIQERYGISKDEADRQVDSWIKSLDP
jgi:uncharacterized protein YjbJ (UPF0337 family)